MGESWGTSLTFAPVRYPSVSPAHGSTSESESESAVVGKVGGRAWLETACLLASNYLAFPPFPPRHGLGGYTMGGRTHGCGFTKSRSP